MHYGIMDIYKNIHFTFNDCKFQNGSELKNLRQSATSPRCEITTRNRRVQGHEVKNGSTKGTFKRNLFGDTNQDNSVVLAKQLPESSRALFANLAIDSTSQNQLQMDAKTNSKGAYHYFP